MARCVPLMLRACLLGMLSLMAGIAHAQESGSIAGSVRDSTGAVLPGVTVEAASSALIEKVRSVVTDDTGQYRIVDLRPGTYSVTFTLPGFASVRRDGVQLTAGFTANVVAELRVGDVTETITVSGLSPLVDVQNVNQQRVMTREVLDAIPTGKQFTALAQLVPGVNVAGSNGQVNQDVGGITGMSFALATIHGGKEDDQTVRINGMSIASLTSIGNARTNLQDATIEEYGMQMAAAPAEFPYGGI
ncbi:MAG: carboxypeptidase regulatory-like domain-containing protein [Acidimicrobiia bacterium]|nr:carboxypeptidase regulatory-like domain-containing protein [Acidimicrobiia bacterium]